MRKRAARDARAQGKPFRRRSSAEGLSHCSAEPQLGGKARPESAARASVRKPKFMGHGAKD
eukprot:7715501-Alexandrium_andersonii.AAC.1